MADGVGGVGAAGAGPNMDLLWYLLAGVGGALGGKGSWQEALGGGTQQFMAARSARDTLGKILAGGGKFSADGEGWTLKGTNPAGPVAGAGAVQPQAGSPAEQFPATVPTSQGGSGIDWSNSRNLPGLSLQSLMKAGLLNPPSSPLGISDANLVGLTPEFLNQALRTGLASQELQGRNRETELEHIARMAKIANTDERTAEIKNYEYAVQQGYKGSLADFKDASSTSHMKDYEAAVAGGYEGGFNQWMMELRKAGATNINLGEQTERKQMEKRVATEEYFASPQFNEDVEKSLSDPVLNATIQSDKNPTKRKAVETIKVIERKIAASGGKIVAPPRRDGNDIVWTVRFKSGRVDEVRYGF